MMEVGVGAVFPLVFNDGEIEHNMGNIRVHPSLDFKSFQTILAQKIGLFPTQISIYLVDLKSPTLWPEDRRKIPITSNSSYSLIAQEKNCFLYVVVKGPRRGASRRKKSSPVPQNFFLLRRNQPELNGAQFSPYYNQISHSNMQIPRENQAMLSSNYPSWDSGIANSSFLDLNAFPRIEDSYGKNVGNRRLCNKCTELEKSGKTAEFHLCVYDVVVKNFRTRVGPIARPSKAS